MKDTLISFETAKLAKDKGFNIPINEGYRKSGTFCDGKGFLANLTKYPAPTQSLLQKWLRERHNIQISILHDWYLYDVVIMKPELDEDIKLISTMSGNSPYCFMEYEEALEAGLLESLNLLPDVT